VRILPEQGVHLLCCLALDVAPGAARYIATASRTSDAVLTPVRWAARWSWSIIWSSKNTVVRFMPYICCIYVTLSNSRMGTRSSGTAF
jgi:hypothetical protein